jgi:hypothetical protein
MLGTQLRRPSILFSRELRATSTRKERARKELHLRAVRSALHTIDGEKQAHSIWAVPDATGSMTPVASDCSRLYAHIPIHFLFFHTEYYRH